jgi:hypothetical protein
MLIRLCSCGFGTDDDNWFECHLIDNGDHSERVLNPLLYSVFLRSVNRTSLN